MACIIVNKTNAQQIQKGIDSLSEALKNYHAACMQPCAKDSVKVNLLLQLGKELAFAKYDTALLLANTALLFAQNIKWLKGVANAYHFKGYLYYLKGHYDSAEENYLKALTNWATLEKETPSNSQRAILISKSKTLSNLGIIYVNQGQYSRGLDCYYKSLQIDEALLNNAGVSKNLICIGIVHGEQNKPQKALDYYFKALKIEGENGDMQRISSAYGNIGQEYDILGQYGKALEYQFKALKIFEQTGDTYKIAGLYLDIGSLYGKELRFDSSKYYLEKGLELSEQNKDIWTQARILGSLGKAFSLTKDYVTAKKYLLKGLSLSDSTNDITSKRTVHEELSYMYENVGEYKNALQHYKLAMIAKDSLLNDTLIQKMTSAELNYQFQKQQDSAKIIQEKKDALSIQEIQKQKLIRNVTIGGFAALTIIGFLGFVSFRNKRKREKAELFQRVAETEMKALRVQMNPHFIFNALGSIDSFLFNNNSADANNYLLKYKQLMRLILENSQHREVAVKEDMEALELYMQLESIRLAYPFTYHINLDDTIDEEETTIPPLILQPFVENSILHGLQRRTTSGGHIDITIEKQNDVLICTVEDNGGGRQVNIQTMQQGIKKESLGMKLTEERLKIINELKKVKAYFTITDLYSNNNTPIGTRVQLTLPVAS